MILSSNRTKRLDSVAEMMRTGVPLSIATFPGTPLVQHDKLQIFQRIVHVRLDAELLERLVQIIAAVPSVGDRI